MHCSCCSKSMFWVKEMLNSEYIKPAGLHIVELCSAEYITEVGSQSHSQLAENSVLDFMLN